MTDMDVEGRGGRSWMDMDVEARGGRSWTDMDVVGRGGGTSRAGVCGPPSSETAFFLRRFGLDTGSGNLTSGNSWSDLEWWSVGGGLMSRNDFVDLDRETSFGQMSGGLGATGSGT